MSSQFIASIIIIRNLSREDYGVIGIVAGYFALIVVVNITLEPVLLRDHRKFYNINKVIYTFTVFNLAKILFLTAITFVFYLMLSDYYNKSFVYPIASILLLTSLDSLIYPIIVCASIQFKQHLVTRVSFLRVFLNVILLFGLFYTPTLRYIFVKDVIVTFFTLSYWIVLSIKKLNISFKGYSYKDIEIEYIKKVILDYSIWIHFNSVATNILYRIDAVLLSLFISVSDVGNYNISLNSANIANVIPGILGYQNKIAISHLDNIRESNNISNIFVRVSLYIGILTLLTFYLFGDFYLSILTGHKSNHDMYIYMLFIVTSLIIVKSFASPFISYIEIKYSVKDLFFKTTMPVLLIALIIYSCSAMYFGALGAAVSNMIVSIIWLALIFNLLITNEYDFKTIMHMKSDLRYVKNIFVHRKWFL